MKKTICILILLTLAVPGMSYAGAYVLGNFGFGGRSNHLSGGAEFGGIFLSDLHPTGGSFSAGIGFSVSVPDSDQKVPHNNGTDIPTPRPNELSNDSYNDGNEYEGCATFGAELAPSFFLNIGAGYAWWKEDTVGVFNDGYKYITDTKNKNEVTGMLGVRYAIEGFTMGLGFHTRRGIVLSLGVAFN
jgi:hypothetical protein